MIGSLYCRCEANDGYQNISNSWYYDSINVTMPPWQLNSTWGANGVLARFDNVIMSLWVLFQVRKSYFEIQIGFYLNDTEMSPLLLPISYKCDRPVKLPNLLII